MTFDTRRHPVLAVLVLSALAVLASACAEQTRPAAAAVSDGATAHNVLVVTLDGLRWQEMLGGFDASLNSKDAGRVSSPDALAHRFDRPTSEERREALLPFLWKTVAAEGQVFADARVTNGKLFSYPGYSELLAGVADPRIDSNAKAVNPNLNVLEWLSRRPGFEGQVAAFASWDVFPYILAAERAGLPVNASGPAVTDPRTERERLLNAFSADLPAYWGSARFDAITMQGALEHLRTRTPRVLYVALDETDEWGHERRYDLYLDAAHRSDRFIGQLWEVAQSLPSHRGKTALVVATDHGRGDGPGDWTDHGEKVPEADRIWIALMGPDTPARGVRTDTGATQSQVAATVAHLLGEDFRSGVPEAAAPLPGVTR
jgi:hypothetical protein